MDKAATPVPWGPRDVIANRLMMIRRNNPDMGGPNPFDYRHADELWAELQQFLTDNTETPVPCDECGGAKEVTFGEWPINTVVPCPTCSTLDNTDSSVSP